MNLLTAWNTLLLWLKNFALPLVLHLAVATFFHELDVQMISPQLGIWVALLLPCMV